MLKKNKRTIIIVTGLCLLVAAALVVFSSLGMQQTADLKQPHAGATDNDRSDKQAGALSGRGLKTASGPAAATTAADLIDHRQSGYPDALLELLGVDSNWLAEQGAHFLKSEIHTEWMGRIDAVLSGKDSAKKDAMAQNQTALLAIKEALNAAYLSGQLDWETFRNSVAELLKWHQDTYAALLSPAEYEALFEFKPEDAANIIDAMVAEAPQYSFILNQEIPVKEVTQQIQPYKLEEVNAHFNQMALDKDQIGQWIESGELTLEEAREALSLSQQQYIARCKEILTPEEIDLIFGSLKNLETGSTQTEVPAVLGTADIDQLGFKIENPQTSVQMVTEQIAKNKIEDLNFLFESTNHEKETLIEKLNAGKITPDQIDSQFTAIEAAYLEKCRKILTEEEFKLIFEDPPGQNS